ncbi:golgin subfamily A member 6-like protein 25 [Macrobrachium nipponense]|uniref:golgin subfamily A member 6-like protein 25 n=1 Tax=Macrobrachium nipponense TaxID=159736 RepID=UPI0030C85636
MLAMLLNNLTSCVQEGLVSLYNLYFGRDVAVTLFRIDEALVCEGPVVTPAVTAGWWTGGIPLVAVVAGGAAACLTSLALATWQIRRHEATRKQLLKEIEDLRKENTCVVAEFRKREEELVSKTEELDIELQHRDQLVQDLLADEERLKEDVYILEEKLLDMERLLKESRLSTEDLKTTYEDMIADKEHQIEDLLAKEEKNKEDCANLGRKLLVTLTNNEEMDRRMKEEAELAVYRQTLIEARDEQIQVLLIKKDKVQEACDRLERNLLEALSRNVDMETLLEEKEREKNELKHLFDNLIEKKNHQIKDLLAEEGKLKEEKGHLAGSLEDALRNVEEMERVLKMEKEQKLELTIIYEKRIEDLYVHIKELLAEEGKLKEEKGHLAERLEDALRNVKEMEKVLKMEKQQNLELANIYEKRIEDLYTHIKGLLAEEGRLKAERGYLAEKLGDTLNTVEELEKLLNKEKDEKVELTKNYEEMVDELYVSVKDLLAKEAQQKEEKELLEQKIKELLAKEKKLEKSKESMENKLEKALCSSHQMEKLWKEEQEMKLTMEIRWQQAMQEKEEELNMLRQKCEESDVKERLRERTEKQNLEKLQELTGNCEELQKKSQEEKEYLAEKLGDTLNTVEELEKLLNKEKDEKVELTKNYEEMVDELYVSVKDLLAKEAQQKEEKELLEQKIKELLAKEKKLEKSKESMEDKLEKALCSSHQMEKLWKEEQEMKLTMEMKWQQAIQEKEKELNMWRQKCEESDVKEKLRARTEKQNLEKLQELTENCEELQKKCQAAEAAKAKEEIHNREWRRKQAEALRKQDKFLLMRLFNGITHRNNLLENTGKEEGGRNEQENVSHQEYCCDQEENTGYLKNQWSAVNDIVKDILKGQSSAEKGSSSAAGTSAIEDGSCWSPIDAAD